MINYSCSDNMASRSFWKRKIIGNLTVVFGFCIQWLSWCVRAVAGIGLSTDYTDFHRVVRPQSKRRIAADSSGRPDGAVDG